MSVRAWGLNLEIRVPDEMVTESAKRLTASAVGLEMPPYCEVQPRVCGCGECPQALRQTRVTGPATDYFVYGQYGYARSRCGYLCGVCGDVHHLSFIQKFSKGSMLKGKEGEDTW